jgi:hypothetical protein
MLYLADLLALALGLSQLSHKFKGTTRITRVSSEPSFHKLPRQYCQRTNYQNFDASFKTDFHRERPFSPLTKQMAHTTLTGPLIANRHGSV